MAAIDPMTALPRLYGIRYNGYRDTLVRRSWHRRSIQWGAKRSSSAGLADSTLAIARRKLDQLNRVREIRELSVPPGNQLERLAGNRVGQHSIRINEQYRVCFRWESGYADQVEITDYH